MNKDLIYVYIMAAVLVLISVWAVLAIFSPPPPPPLQPINTCLQNVKTGAWECYEPAPWWHFWESTIMVTPTPHP